MKRTNNEPLVFEQVGILDAGSEGMAVARVNDRVIFVPFAVPGDIADIQVIRRKRNYLEGKILRIRRPSEKRQDPFCSHFGVCGGCRWQNMKYAEQLFYKQKQVSDSLTRIGKLRDPLILPILSSQDTTYYRNKLEFTFSNHRWLTANDKREEGRLPETNALGFHIPQFFDKIVDIGHCYLQRDPSNAIRMAVRADAVKEGFTFYDPRTWTGFLRNLIIRTSESGSVMVILVVRDPEEEIIRGILSRLSEKFPEITSMYYVVNPKQNDSLYDLEYRLFKGDPFIEETMKPLREGYPEIRYRIGPSSFFQTNTRQAGILYRTAAEFAGFRGGETVYDLYSGTGTISLYIAPYVSRVIGIETVGAAVADARINAKVNGFSNAEFFSGEAEKLLSPGFFAAHGRPDIIITDPPRNGMHEKVIRSILDSAPARIVYVSCNPATQARDLALLGEAYEMERSQPVDMFPHTQHVENVALLTRRV